MKVGLDLGTVQVGGSTRATGPNRVASKAQR